MAPDKLINRKARPSAGSRAVAPPVPQRVSLREQLKAQARGVLRFKTMNRKWLWVPSQAINQPDIGMLDRFLGGTNTVRSSRKSKKFCAHAKPNAGRIGLFPTAVISIAQTLYVKKAALNSGAPVMYS
jgi:hypothetical protein